MDWQFDDLLFKCQAATIPNSRGSKTKIRAINPSPYIRRKQLDPAKPKSKLPHPQNTDFANKKKTNLLHENDKYN
jgi:hypothetical protein